MVGPFLATMLVVALLLVNWRLTLVMLLAGLIALIVLGIGVVQPENVDAVGLPALVDHGHAVLSTVSLGEISPPTLR